MPDSDLFVTPSFDAPPAGAVERLNEHDVAARATIAATHQADDYGDAPAIDLRLLRRYRDLRDAQAVSEAEAKAMKDEANKLEAQLVEMFSEAGIQNMQVDGKTIYLHRSTYAQRKPGVEAEDVIAALRAAGAGDLVKDTVNANTLSAYVRELVENAEDGVGDGLPPEVAEVLELGERFAVRINAAGSRKKSQTHSK